MDSPGSSAAAHGLRLLLEHGFTLAAVAALLATSFGIGRVALRRGDPWNLPSPLALITSVLLGAGILALVFLLLGALGLLHRSVVIAVLGVGAVASRDAIGELPGRLAAAAGEVRAQVPPVFIAVVLVTVALLLALALSPPTDYDSLMYHLDLPAEFLRAGRINVPPDNFHVAQFGVAHALYLPLIAMAGPEAPAVLEVSFVLLLALTVYQTFHDHAGPGASALAMTTIMGTTALALVAPTARVDAAHLLYLFAAQSVLVFANSTSHSRKALAIAGLLAGLAIGVKVHAALYTLALAPSAYLVGRSGRTRWQEPLAAVAIFAVAAFLGALPWLAKNAMLMGAPFYPILAYPQLPPWLAQGYVTDPGVYRSLAASPLSQVRTPVNLFDLLLAPARLTPESEGRLYMMNPFLVAVPLAPLAFRDRRALLTLLLPPVFYAAGLLAYTRYINLRYLIPTFVPLAATGAATVGALLQRFARVRLARIGLALLAVGGGVPALLVLEWRLLDTGALTHVAGQRSSAEYLRSTEDPEVGRHMAVVDAVNAAVPPDGRVLLLFEGRGFYFEVPVIQDNLLTNWGLTLATGATDDCLRRAGVTHVLVATGALDYYVQRGLDTTRIRWPEFRAFSERCLRSVISSPEFTLYQVSGSGMASPRS